jgi:GNAT superfamily N-acetyltransferase
MDVRRLGVQEMRRALAGIDRTEHVDVQYEVVDGVLRERPVRMADVPPWDDARVDAFVAEYGPIVSAGAAMFVALDDDDRGEVGGVAIVDPTFEPPMAWLAFLHVSRPHRRTGVATALWSAAADLARMSGARSMYVSATSTGSAVGFYLSRGCRLADPPHARLFAEEPVDIHLICDL